MKNTEPRQGSGGAVNELAPASALMEPAVCQGTQLGPRRSKHAPVCPPLMDAESLEGCVHQLSEDPSKKWQQADGESPPPANAKPPPPSSFQFQHTLLWTQRQLGPWNYTLSVKRKSPKGSPLFLAPGTAASE